MTRSGSTGGLRRGVVVAVTLALAVLATVAVGSVAPAVADATYTVSGTVTGALSGGDHNIAVSQQVPAGEGQLSVDDGYSYDYPDPTVVFDTDGTYSVSGLVAGDYRFDFTSCDNSTGDCVHFRSYSHVAGDITGSNGAMGETPTCQLSGQTSGVTQVGQTLTAPAPTISSSSYAAVYQWHRLDAAGHDELIVGARARTYTLTAADAGDQVAPDVMATSSDATTNYGTANCDDPNQLAWSSTVQPVAEVSAAPVQATFAIGKVGKPRGQARVGKVLRAPRLALPASTTVRLTWYRVVKVRHHTVLRKISGASRYRIRQRDAGARLLVRISLTAPGYTPATVQSASVRIRR